MGGVHGIVAAVVEEIADVVGLEHFDQALVLRPILVDAGQLVARRSERAARGVTQPAHRRRGLLPHIDHVFGEGADDAVPPRVEFADLVPVLARRLDHAAGGGVDDGGDAAGLGIERILSGHMSIPRITSRAG